VIDRASEIVQTIADGEFPSGRSFPYDSDSEGVIDGGISERVAGLRIDLFDNLVRFRIEKLPNLGIEGLQVMLCPAELRPSGTQVDGHG